LAQNVPPPILHAAPTERPLQAEPPTFQGYVNDVNAIILNASDSKLKEEFRKQGVPETGNYLDDAVRLLRRMAEGNREALQKKVFVSDYRTFCAVNKDFFQRSERLEHRLEISSTSD